MAVQYYHPESSSRPSLWELDDRATFRRFRGFTAHEPTPGRTAFVRFRGEQARRGLDLVLFDAVTL